MNSYSTLSCGCEWIDNGAVYHVNRCAEAERLYARTEFPFRMALGTGHWETYDRAAEAYKAHFGEEQS